MVADLIQLTGLFGRETHAQVLECDSVPGGQNDVVADLEKRFLLVGQIEDSTFNGTELQCRENERDGYENGNMALQCIYGI